MGRLRVTSVTYCVPRTVAALSVNPRGVCSLFQNTERVTGRPEAVSSCGEEDEGLAGEDSCLGWRWNVWLLSVLLVGPFQFPLFPFLASGCLPTFISSFLFG
jgi:hypothetical protein